MQVFKLPVIVSAVTPMTVMINTQAVVEVHALEMLNIGVEGDGQIWCMKQV